MLVKLQFFANAINKQDQVIDFIIKKLVSLNEGMEVSFVFLERNYFGDPCNA